MPPWSSANDIFFHCYLIPFLEAQTHLYVPELCRLMLTKDRDVLQLACWSCESTAGIVQHFVDASDEDAISAVAQSTPEPLAILDGDVERGDEATCTAGADNAGCSHDNSTEKPTPPTLEEPMMELQEPMTLGTSSLVALISVATAHCHLFRAGVAARSGQAECKDG